MFPHRFSTVCARTGACNRARHGAQRARLAAIAVLSLALLATASAQVPVTVDPPPAFRAPYMPAGDEEVLQEVPSVSDPAVAQMKVLRSRFDADRSNLSVALLLADAYVDYGRQIGDAHYAGYAEAIIRPWMNRSDTPSGVLVTQATILQYRHQFDEARAALQKAFKVDPRNAQAWLTLATLDMVQGDYPAAGKDCTEVTNVAGVELGLACLGNLRSYVGHARQSLALLQQVERGAQAAPAYRAWVQGLLAETAERLGDWPLAEAHYVNALKWQPRDNFLLVAYADLLLDRGRPNEVLPLLAGHEQSDTAYLRITLAQAALHSPDLPRYTWVMAARFEALALRGSDYFGREQSRFALSLQHDAQTALDMARRNWQVQRAPWDIRIVLEAALAAHQPQAAAEALDFFRKTKLEDPIIESLARELASQAPNHITDTRT